MGRLVLASSSQARRMLLANAGLTFDAMAAAIDERAIEDAMGAEQSGRCRAGACPPQGA